MLVFALLWAQPGTLQVAVVENTNSAASRELTAFYCEKRGVKNVVRVSCPDSASSTANETIDYPDFSVKIEAPVRDYLASHKEVGAIVLTKGVPIRVTHVPGLGFGDNRTSLDSLLAALDYGSKPGSKKIELHDNGFNGSAYINPYWNSTERFSRAKFGLVLVTRLDGYTVEDAKGLVTWSVVSDSSHPKGVFLLDACKGFGFGDVQKQPLPPTADGMVISELAYREWNADIVRSAGELKAKGMDTMLDGEDAFIGGVGNLIGYVSWGSNDQHFDAGSYHLLRFAPGGIAETAVSTSARTFLPTQGGQSLIADLVRQRACGAKGYCDEPLLQAVASPTILFDRYSRGWTLAESYFAASRFIGWEDIVLGDPLCAPFAD